MRVGIIGAGFTGLSAAYQLSGRGHEVTIFEADSAPGGLAVGFTDPLWQWSLEKHYHHLFVSDRSIRQLAADVHHHISFTRPVTSSYIRNRFFQTDSPASLLRFAPLTVFDRLRTGVGLATLKFNPFWQPLEHISAKNYIISVFGRSSWTTLWEPLLVGKFGSSADSISAAWFWARIYKRSSSLGYPDGGFLSLAQNLAQAAAKLGAGLLYSTSVSSVKPISGRRLSLLTSSGQKFEFDKVISTLPSFATAKISGLDLPVLPGLGAVTLVLSLSRDFLPGHVYWLNICDRSFPFLSVVEHTHFVDPGHYNHEHLVYIGNYLPASHPYFHATSQSLLHIFAPFLKKINPEFSESFVNRSWLWSAPFAQPIVGLGYSRLLPPLSTSIPNFFMANMQQVYPWDRGTNYAVELGNKVTGLI